MNDLILIFSHLHINIYLIFFIMHKLF